MRNSLSNQDKAVCNLISKANSDINSRRTSTPSTQEAVKHTSNIARVIQGYGRSAVYKLADSKPF
jgi:hypothetical protein